MRRRGYVADVREAFDRFWAEYCYLFMDGVWFCSDGNGWQPVADWLE